MFARRVPPYGIWEYFFALEGPPSPPYLQRAYPERKESRQAVGDLAALGSGFR